MRKFVSFTKIGQYKNVIRELTDNVRYVGKDESGSPIFDPTRQLPTITFTGTVKLHGTNAGVSICGDEMWAQSRSNIITPEKDNAGFARFVEENNEAFRNILESAKERYNVKDGEILTVFGEWCGGKIQAGVALNQLDKRFVVFAVKVSQLKNEEYDEWEGTYYPSDSIRNHESNIFNILDYQTYTVDVNFDNPRESQNIFVDLTNDVEKECPFAKAFGVSGTGEGIVWTAWYNDKCYRFKTKGKKHSVSKVKTLAPIDPELMKSINDFVDYSVTENRLNQGIEQIFSDNPLDIKKIGDFIKWVVGDVMTEEADVLENSNLTGKDVAKQISNKARNWFLEKYNS